MSLLGDLHSNLAGAIAVTFCQTMTVPPRATGRGDVFRGRRLSAHGGGRRAGDRSRGPYSHYHALPCIFP
jgi:hypothetical protein